MLPKEKRISDTREFKRVYQKGSFFSHSGFNVNYLPNRMRFSRLAIVITKKTESKAVGRNKLKRRFRAATKQVYGALAPGFDVVITIKPASKTQDFSAILKDVENAMGKVGTREKGRR